MKKLPDEHSPGGAATAAGPVTPDLVRQLLHDVIDPEVGVNIIDLGLVYGVDVSEEAILVRMTLTSPGCPLGAYFGDELDRVLGALPGDARIDVELVWDPPWGPDKMTDEAKRQLGWLR